MRSGLHGSTPPTFATCQSNRFRIGSSFFGHGMQQSYDGARQQFEKAAALGDPSAIKNLGFMYDQGRGVKATCTRRSRITRRRRTTRP